MTTSREAPPSGVFNQGELPSPTPQADTSPLKKWMPTARLSPSWSPNWSSPGDLLPLAPILRGMPEGVMASPMSNLK